MAKHPLYWAFFTGGILVLLLLDLGVLHRRQRRISTSDALRGCLIWAGFALAFNVYLYFQHGQHRAIEFLTGYVIEGSLSVDNIFMFIVLFSFFRVPEHLQHRVLFWGLLGAIAMRAAFILIGAALLHRFHWVMYLFGAFLVATGVRLLFHHDQEIHPEQNPVLRLFRRIVPVTHDYEGGRFFVCRSGRLFATPLAVVLIMIEATDLIFAFDSIPAIFGVTQDPFIVFTSNIFAILGLRSLYFLMAGVMGLFRYLPVGLALVLLFIGGKMIVSGFVTIPTSVALGVVFLILTAAIVASLRVPVQDN